MSYMTVAVKLVQIIPHSHSQALRAAHAQLQLSEVYTHRLIVPSMTHLANDICFIDDVHKLEQSRTSLG